MARNNVSFSSTLFLLSLSLSLLWLVCLAVTTKTWNGKTNFSAFSFKLPPPSLPKKNKTTKTKNNKILFLFSHRLDVVVVAFFDYDSESNLQLVIKGISEWQQRKEGRNCYTRCGWPNLFYRLTSFLFLLRRWEKHLDFLFCVCYPTVSIRVYLARPVESPCQFQWRYRDVPFFCCLWVNYYEITRNPRQNSPDRSWYTLRIICNPVKVISLNMFLFFLFSKSFEALSLYSAIIRDKAVWLISGWDMKMDFE